MSTMAIIAGGRLRRVRAVHIEADDDGLTIVEPDGTIDHVPWWRLVRVGDGHATRRFRRVGAPSWEMKVDAGVDEALLARVRRKRFPRFGQMFRSRLGLQTIGIGVALMFVGFDYIPADWTARLMFPPVQERLVAGVLGQNANTRCTGTGGEAALRKLLVRLDSDRGSSVEIFGSDLQSILVTSLPANKIFLVRGALTEIEADALAALLAHELVHLRHGDPTAAVVRSYGNLGVLGIALEGEDRRELRLRFSGSEERRADLEAIRMMREAEIPLAPAAEMFELMRVEAARGRWFADEQRELHFGIGARAERWRAAARLDPPTRRSALTTEEADALFNFCWSGPI